MKITKINTRPEHDPYQNISGVCSYTVLSFDPRDDTITVSQEYKTNSMSMAVYRDLVLECVIPNHPLDIDVREEIENMFDLFETVRKGHSEDWNGNDFWGVLNDDARDAWNQIEDRLETFGVRYGENGYSYWKISEWCQDTEVSANTTNEQIDEIATDVIEAAEYEHVVLDGDRDDVVEWLRERRNNLREKEE